ncbi:hypothetical protein AALA52_10110 [Lactococcus ileimucosae]|uniref:Uncharacterized protein n=1 Tax=Lactococcus ileimucosae TaxID=2941329 RepID=A0ABV4D853_9LACT
MKKSILISVGILTAIALALGIGGKKYMNAQTHEKNLENQRQAALSLKKEEPHVTKVVFTSEGSYPGVGIPWTVGAKVMMGGEVFNMSLRKDKILIINYGTDEAKMNKYDEIHKKTPFNVIPMEIIYSNGKREVIK